MSLTDSSFLEKGQYDAIIIPTAFNSFEKQQGMTFLIQLLNQTKTHPSLEALPVLTAQGLLSILYVLPHQNLTGGLKMLYEQMIIEMK